MKKYNLLPRLTHGNAPPSETRGRSFRSLVVALNNVLHARIGKLHFAYVYHPSHSPAEPYRQPLAYTMRRSVNSKPTFHTTLPYPKTHRGSPGAHRRGSRAITKP